MIQKPKGTNDVLFEEGLELRKLIQIIDEMMERYNYDYIRTPIFESSELFHRSVGEATDMVSKETYDFIDRGGRNMSLRPEGTAGVVRSFLENKIYGTKSLPVKLFYYGPMFRYERPQSGRSREFYQFGVECFGSNNPLLDAEVISVAVNLFKSLGLKNVTVNINTIGDFKSRENYIFALKDYLKPHLNTLCEDCNYRFNKNPLRILDCKVDQENKVLKEVPKIIDYLSEESINHFNKVKEALDNMDIKYVVNPNLVRGIDYYTETVFEVSADIKDFGANNILCGGGRYNNLVANLNGPDTPAVGFALGVERILLALAKENILLASNKSLDTYIMPLDTSCNLYATKINNLLREYGYKSDIDYLNRNIAKGFKQADLNNAKFVIIIGSEELENKVLTIKNNITKEENKVEEKYLFHFLKEKLDDMITYQEINIKDLEIEGEVREHI